MTPPTLHSTPLFHLLRSFYCTQFALLSHLTSTLLSSAQENVVLRPKNSSRALFRPRPRRQFFYSSAMLPLIDLHSINRLSADSTKVVCTFSEQLSFQGTIAAYRNHDAISHASAQCMLGNMRNRTILATVAASLRLFVFVTCDLHTGG